MIKIRLFSNINGQIFIIPQFITIFFKKRQLFDEVQLLKVKQFLVNFMIDGSTGNFRILIKNLM